MSDDLNLIFRLGVAGVQESTAAISGFGSKVRAQVGEITADLNQTGGRMQSALSGAINPLTVGLTAVTGAAAAAVTGIYNLAKETSDAGSRFNDLNLKSGISVEILSALDLQLRQSNSSLEALTGGFFILQKNMETGNKETLEIAKSFGITEENIGDADGTLRRLIEGLGKLPTEQQRNAAGAALLGKSFKELSVFVADVDGNFDKVIDSARRAGRVMGEDTARQADFLGDQLDQLDAQFEGLKRTIGIAVMPVVLKAVQDLSNYLDTNRGKVAEWGQTIAGAAERGYSFASSLGRVADGFGEVNSKANSAINAILRYAEAKRQASPFYGGGDKGTPGQGVANPQGDPNNDRDNPAYERAMGLAGGASLTAPTPGTRTRAAGGGGKKGGGGGGRNEAQQLELRNNALFNKELEAVTRQHREILEREYDLGIKDLEAYVVQALNENETHYTNQLRSFDRQEEIARKHTKSQTELNQKLKDIAFEREQAKDARNKEAQRIADDAARTRDANALALEKQLADIQESVRAGALQRAEAQREAGLITESQLLQRRQELQEQAFNDQKILLDLELVAFGLNEARKTEIGNRLIKLAQDRANAEEDASRRIIAAQQAENAAAIGKSLGGATAQAGTDFTGGFSGEGAGGELDFSEQVTIIGAFKDFATNAFSGIAQGFGGMIQAFLGGGAATSKGMASMVKAITAGLAAQALVEAAMQGAHAIKEFALASASAAVFDVRGAALHSAAAAAHVQAAIAFGLVGGVAAAVSAVIPGGGGGAGALASQGSGGGASPSGGLIDRDKSDQPAREIARPKAPQIVEHRHVVDINVRDDDGRILAKVTDALRHSGDFRDEVRNAALA